MYSLRVMAPICTSINIRKVMAYISECALKGCRIRQIIFENTYFYEMMIEARQAISEIFDEVEIRQNWLYIIRHSHSNLLISAAN